jgi:hypothetical protein
VRGWSAGTAAGPCADLGIWEGGGLETAALQAAPLADPQAAPRTKDRRAHRSPPGPSTPPLALRPASLWASSRSDSGSSSSTTRTTSSCRTHRPPVTAITAPHRHRGGSPHTSSGCSAVFHRAHVPSRDVGANIRCPGADSPRQHAPPPQGSAACGVPRPGDVCGSGWGSCGWSRARTRVVRAVRAVSLVVAADGVSSPGCGSCCWA